MKTFVVLFLSLSVCFGQVNIQNGSLKNANLGQAVASGGGGGTWVKIAQVAQGSPDGNGFTTGTPINTGGATFIAIVETWFGTRPAVTDSTGANTYREAVTGDLGDNVPGSDSQTTILYCSNVTTSASHTFTVAGTAVFPSLIVYAYSGGSGGIIDQTNSAPKIGGGTTFQTGSITPNTANQLIVAAACTRLQNPVSIDSGFSTPQILNAAPAQYEGALGSYLIQGAASAVNPTITASGDDFAAGAIASFQ